MARDGIQMSASGSTKDLERFLKMAGKTQEIRRRLEPVAKTGLQALINATPVDTGKTAQSWSYAIVETRRGLSIEYRNANQNQGQSVVVLIRYGHGTRNGGYVPARDFISPVLIPIFDKIANESWKAVTSV